MNHAVSPFISVIIPNHNGAKTIGLCLDAAFASQYDNFEVVVVDDCSSDNSLAIIEKYPCRLFRLQEQGGASRARNTGAENSSGQVFFFIDADCLLQKDTLEKAAAAYRDEGPGVILGGTYTPLPFDLSFFSIFQSIYIHYSETKNPGTPDYVATHAMLIEKDLWQKSGGFNEQFMPILEDVEFSHRLKKMGARLCMAPDILVQHIFNFSFVRSMRNGMRKSKYWSIYSVKNRDLLSDSGTASREFKFNVLSCFMNVLLALLAVLLQSWVFGLLLLLLFGSNLYLNRGLARIFFRVGGPFFAIPAVLYYTFVYPFAVGIGVCSAVFSQHFGLRP